MSQLMQAQVIPQLPPFNDEAEEAMLGSMLIHIDAILAARGIVNAEDFYIIKNRLIYAAIVELHTLRQPIDLITVADRLGARFDEIGGAVYLSHLLNVVPSALNVEGYAAIVREAALRRRLLDAASQIAQLAYATDGRIDDQISESRGALAGVDAGATDSRDILQVVSKVYDQLSDWSHNPLAPGQVRGQSCGLRGIDQMLGGFEPEKLYVIAARPAMGKSSLAFQIGFDMAQRWYKRVLMFSIEMSDEEVVHRQISRMIRVPADDLKRGSIPDSKWPEIVNAYDVIAAMPLVINDSARMTLSKIEATIARYDHVDLVIVDHLGLMSDPALKGENQTQRIGRITWGMKQIAKIYHLPFLAICQLNRGVEGRQDKRPLLSDLRDSGDIEQNADDVLMLYRDSYYDANSKEPNICEVIPRKIRSGDADTITKLYFNKALTEFAEVERHVINR
jgi:replicative DNA helicase